MVKAFGAFFSCYLITVSCIAGAQPADCETGSKFEKNLSELENVAEIAEECPAPTKQQFEAVCVSGYDRHEVKEDSQLRFGFQEHFWKMSCADPEKDTIETAKPKIQAMWNKNKENFKCTGNSEFYASGLNITKFSLDTGFSTFMIDAVKKFNLEMNFIDPTDKKTVMDFIQDEIERYSKMQHIGRAHV